jgi:hypothetical protein
MSLMQHPMENRPHLIATGFTFNNPDLLFNPNCDHTLCKICGAVYQSLLDRDPFADRQHAKVKRMAWSHIHAKTHSESEHRALFISGRWCTPEAAQKLAAFGIVPIIDLVIDNEVEDALKNGYKVPIEDAEGGN